MELTRLVTFTLLLVQPLVNDVHKHNNLTILIRDKKLIPLITLPFMRTVIFLSEGAIGYIGVHTVIASIELRSS